MSALTSAESLDDVDVDEARAGRGTGGRALDIGCCKATESKSVGDATHYWTILVGRECERDDVEERG